MQPTPLQTTNDTYFGSWGDNGLESFLCGTGAAAQSSVPTPARGKLCASGDNAI